MTSALFTAFANTIAEETITTSSTAFDKSNKADLATILDGLAGDAGKKALNLIYRKFDGEVFGSVFLVWMREELRTRGKSHLFGGRKSSSAGSLSNELAQLSLLDNITAADCMQMCKYAIRRMIESRTALGMKLCVQVLSMAVGPEVLLNGYKNVCDNAATDHKDSDALITAVIDFLERASPAATNQVKEEPIKETRPKRNANKRVTRNGSSA